MHTVYLAGPITGVPTTQQIGWRNEVKLRYSDRFEFIDPMDYKVNVAEHAREHQWRAVAETERSNILHSDAVLAYVPQWSMGTAMGILYGCVSDRVVVVVAPEHLDLSPMVRFHAHAVAKDFENALNEISNVLGRNRAHSVRNRKGALIPFDQNRITTAIQKAIDSRQLPPELAPPAEKLSTAVRMQIEKAIALKQINADCLDLEDIQDRVETVLMDNAHCREVYSVARAYIEYRARHAESRKANTRDDATYQFVDKEVLHGMRARVGAIVRACSRGRTELSRQSAEGVRAQLDSIGENAERMRIDLETIRDKIKQRYQAQDVVLTALFSDLSEEHKTDCRFVMECPELLSVKAVPFKLRSLLNNIIDNAIKHGFSGRTDGTVFMSASPLPSGDVLISVENDGAPMAPEHTSSAVHSWHVGLDYIKTLSSELGTDLKVSPGSPAGGAGYRVVFPAALVISGGKRHRRVLVADDSAEDRHDLVCALQRGGFEVVEAGTPETALERVRGCTDICGMVLDVDFKTQHDGFWILERVRKQWPHIKVVVVSGSSMPEWRQKAQQLDAATLDKASYTDKELISHFT